MRFDPSYVSQNVVPVHAGSLIEPLDRSDRNGALTHAIKNRDFNAVYSLLNHTAVDISAVDGQGRTPLHLAIEVGDADIVNQLLVVLSHGDDSSLNAADRKGYTPLMRAVEKGLMPQAKSLIEMGATVMVGQDEDCSAAQLAQKQWTITCTELLLETRGDVVAAFRLSRERGIWGFESVLADAEKSAELLRECELNNIGQAERVIKTGVDASLVLMRYVSGDQLSKVETRNDTVRGLIEAGASPSKMLSYAVAANDEHAARSAIALGADGDMELVSALDNCDVVAVSLLCEIGCVEWIAG